MSRKTQQRTSISDFYCTECMSKGIPIPRQEGKQREPGHLKKMYCFKCNEKKNFVEIKPFGSYTYEDFQLEYELGRFKNGVRTPVKDLTGCKNYICQYNVDGRCWNSNYSNTNCVRERN